MDQSSFIEHAQHESSHWWFLGRREVIVGIVEALRPKKCSSTQLLEIGCGTGATVGTLSEEWDAIGVDISSHAIEIARQRFPKARFVAYQYWDQIVDELHSADVILLLDVLEHVEDDFHFLSEMVSRVRPGCYIILTVPADPSLWSEHDVALFHYRRYMPARLRRAWSEMPLQEILLSELNVRLALPIRLVRRIQTWLASVRPRRVNDDKKKAPQSSLQIPIPAINGLLRRLFASEKNALVNQLTKRVSSGGIGISDSSPSAKPIRGISLVAVLKRLPGECLPRNRPAGVEPDLGVPATFDLGHESRDKEAVH